MVKDANAKGEEETGEQKYDEREEQLEKKIEEQEKKKKKEKEKRRKKESKRKLQTYLNSISILTIKFSLNNRKPAMRFVMLA